MRTWGTVGRGGGLKPMDYDFIPDVPAASYTLILRMWNECTSPTWQRYLSIMWLIDELANEENQ